MKRFNVILGAAVLVALMANGCDESLVIVGNIEDCPPVDIVFIMDTSGSMDDEAEVLCDNIEDLEQDLMDLGLQDIRTTLLGITETDTITETGATGTEEFECLTNTVYRVTGGDGQNHPAVPGNPPADALIDCDGDEYWVEPDELDPWNEESEEFWAPATALIAGSFDWTPDESPALRTVRVVVPISDEAPQIGCTECRNVDTLAVDNAIAVALANNVIVSPIIAEEDGHDECIQELGEKMADDTGGLYTFTGDAGNEDLADAINDIVVDACLVIPAQ